MLPEKLFVFFGLVPTPRMTSSPPIKKTATFLISNKSDIASDQTTEAEIAELNERSLYNANLRMRMKSACPLHRHVRPILTYLRNFFILSFPYRFPYFFLSEIYIFELPSYFQSLVYFPNFPTSVIVLLQLFFFSTSGFRWIPLLKYQVAAIFLRTASKNCPCKSRSASPARSV